MKFVIFSVFLLTITLASAFKDLGCYNDKRDHDLPLRNFLQFNSPAKCIDYCKSKGKSYAALQYGTYCFCGDSYGKYGKTADSRCQVYPCPGDHNQMCGGKMANRVFATNLYEIGCYRDRSSSRDLPDFKRFVHTNSPTECISYCKSQGKRYAAVQTGYDCFCGNSYGRYGLIANSYCEAKSCPGDPTQKCGGLYVNRVFTTHPREIGCYQSMPNEYHPHHAYFYLTNSPDICIVYCKGKGKMYAAVQSEYLCFCGDTYGKYGKVADSRCQEKSCPGDVLDKCGGSSANRVFMVLNEYNHTRF